jgi:predicted transcriptional regulator
MKAMLIEMDADLAAALDRVAPARSRGRSEFVRAALRKALWELEEKATAEAYRRLPDSAAATYFDPGVWESGERKSTRRPGPGK